MTWRSKGRTGLVRFWKTSALRFREVLARLTEERRNDVGEAYLLHPRCCRTEQHQESL
jgi:hypothetical protein